MSKMQFFLELTTQEQALEFLEEVRWGANPHCPYCFSEMVGRHASADRKIPRWQCRSCGRAFSVTVGTPFHGTHLPLKTWFVALALLLDADRKPTASQIARDLGLRRATVSSMMKKINMAIEESEEQKALLSKIAQ